MSIFFKDFDDAHFKLGLPGSGKKEINCVDNTISSLKFSEKYRTYHNLRNKNRIIDFVGNGLQQFNGYPTSNHSLSNQSMFFNSWRFQNKIPVLKEHFDGTVELLGDYKVCGIKKVLGNNGFAFFHFHLIRHSI